MAIDTVVSGDSVDVVGPPPSVIVNVDIGPEGNRGSIFFSGYGVPDPLSISESQLGDLYINRELGANYGVVYRLSAVPGGTSWESILKFQPKKRTIVIILLFWEKNDNCKIYLLWNLVKIN